MELFNDCRSLVEVLIRRVGFCGYIPIVSLNGLTYSDEDDEDEDFSLRSK